MIAIQKNNLLELVLPKSIYFSYDDDIYVVHSTIYFEIFPSVSRV